MYLRKNGREQDGRAVSVTVYAVPALTSRKTRSVSRREEAL
jgi:hypothetical protein